MYPLYFKFFCHCLLPLDMNITGWPLKDVVPVVCLSIDLTYFALQGNLYHMVWLCLFKCCRRVHLCENIPSCRQYHVNIRCLRGSSSYLLQTQVYRYLNEMCLCIDTKRTPSFPFGHVYGSSPSPLCS